MGVIKSGHNSAGFPNNFGASDAVTADALNNHVNDSTFNTTAVDDSTIEVYDSGAKIRVKDDGVTFAKIQNISTDKVLGRTTAGSGAVEEVDFLDENDMNSDSDTAVATQQSIKAYVDTYRRPNIVTTNNTAASSVSATTDWTDFPSLEVTITPRLASSTFIIDVQALLGNYASQMLQGKIQFKVNSGSYADIVTADSPDSRTSVHGILDMDYDNNEWGGQLQIHIGSSSLSYSVGDTITFKLQVRNYKDSYPLYFNRTESDDNTSRKFRGVSTITVQEI
jgi:hypothetical protein|tara:strand:- start:1147 stop:1986 length:840 start_codon:yes stop_codon:yes gene_type:complete